MPSGVFNSSTRNSTGAPLTLTATAANTNPHKVPRRPIPRMVFTALPNSKWQYIPNENR